MGTIATVLALGVVGTAVGSMIGLNLTKPGARPWTLPTRRDTFPLAMGAVAGLVALIVLTFVMAVSP